MTNLNNVGTNVYDKSAKITCYDLLWLRRLFFRFDFENRNFTFPRMFEPDSQKVEQSSKKQSGRNSIFAES